MGTHYKGNYEETTALNTYIKLLRAAESVRSRLNLFLTKFNLTESQFNVLEALQHLGPLSQKELGSKLLKSGGNITMVIDHLQKRGLVLRERGILDKRYFTIHLTSEGEILIEDIFPKILSLIKNEVNVLNEREQLDFQRMCKLVGIKGN